MWSKWRWGWAAMPAGWWMSARARGRKSPTLRVLSFVGHEFRVTPDVLIPRPETEHVVEVALGVARDARRLVDVGTGSGALAVTLQLARYAPAFAVGVWVGGVGVWG